jgi:hypothetical protein
MPQVGVAAAAGREPDLELVRAQHRVALAEAAVEVDQERRLGEVLGDGPTRGGVEVPLAVERVEGGEGHAQAVRAHPQAVELRQRELVDADVGGDGEGLVHGRALQFEQFEALAAVEHRPGAEAVGVGEDRAQVAEAAEAGDGRTGLDRRRHRGLVQQGLRRP